ncbi:MAG: hypothetical protein EOO73_32710 [Myxococcales bacterium]|nr:MAG: hypothetical protein EOO73_32710 [Myxococcales bacterium]
MVRRYVALAVASSVLLSLSCSKKEDKVEQGSAPPPVASSKPGACTAGGGTVSDAVSSAYFPRTASGYCIDPNGDARTYGEAAKGTLETVCTELLDGECEVYKNYGLKRVVTLRYVDGAGSSGTVNVTASRFATAEGAYAFFTKRVIADGDPADGTPKEIAAGGKGALGTGIAYVWRGEIVAELSYSNELETPDQIKATSAKILPELAQKIGDQLPGEVSALPSVRLLPPVNLVPMGVTYHHRDALGIAGLGSGAVGFYQDGGARYRVVGLARPDEDSAKDVLGTLKKLPGAKVQKDLGFDAVLFTTREAEGAPQAEWLAGRSGSQVLIVGDEPLKLKPGSGAEAAHYPADKRLALLKAALSDKR